mmetsp:Transcript_1366/g.2491  ORF Transcript_1366/g.2491 Transcript_1366/m.2491 type:complete len:361 (-) Transcript_1366:139-1221(-)
MRASFERKWVAHDRVVWSLSFNSDSTLIASLAFNNSVCIWNIHNPLHNRSLNAHTQPISSVLFSPHVAHLLASASHDTTVRLWNAITGQLLHTLDKHCQPIWMLAFAPDSTILASASKDSHIHLWCPFSGKWIAQLQNHDLFVVCITFSSSGQYFASSSYDGSVNLYDVRNSHNPRLIHVLRASHAVTVVRFHISSKIILGASSNAYLHAWNVESGALLYSQDTNPSGRLRSLSICRSYNVLVSRSDSNEVTVRDVVDASVILRLPVLIGDLAVTEVSPDEHVIITGGSNKVARLWSLKDGALIQELSVHQSKIISLQFSTNGRFFALGFEDGTIALCNYDPMWKCFQRNRFIPRLVFRT